MTEAAGVKDLVSGGTSGKEDEDQAKGSSGPAGAFQPPLQGPALPVPGSGKSQPRHGLCLILPVA